MPTLSPLIASYQPPFLGMDTRSVKQQGAPSLLLNVDLSDKGVLKGRPGSKVFVNVSDYLGAPGKAPLQTRGLFAYTYEKKLFLFVIVFDPELDRHTLVIYDGSGNLRSLFGLTWKVSSSQPEYDLEPTSKIMGKAHYVFAPAGRFVYFSNGVSNLYRIEIRDQVSGNGSITNPNYENFDLISNFFEEGSLPLVRNYLLSGVVPSSLSYFFDQLIATGFKRDRVCGLSIPVKPKNEKEHPVPPEQLVELQRDLVTLDPSSIVVSEPLLWDSYPINDPGGFYWTIHEDVVAAVGVGTEILVFTEDHLYKIIGAGSNLPKKIKFAEVSLASSRSYCYFNDNLFFVGIDGCYVVNPQSIRKVSGPMDDLWFSRKKPEVTRYSESRLKNTAFPYFVDLENISSAHCVNDRARQQVMVSLKSLGADSNDMVWVFNYSDMMDGSGPGKWSIWTSSDQSEYTAASLTPGTAFPDYPTRQTSPTVASGSASNNVYNWAASTQAIVDGTQKIFFANNPSEYAETPYTDETRCLIYEFGTSRQDLSTSRRFDNAGVASGADNPVHFPFLVSLGRVGRADHDGRIICTDVAVRRRQLCKNVEDDENASKLTAIVRSEGEGLRYFDATETDVEFPDTIYNSQVGISENTKSTLNTMKLGSKPNGTSSPLISSEYFDSYARVNTPDEEGRSAYVDLYSMPTSQPLRLTISEVRVYGDVKGGSQREQS